MADVVSTLGRVRAARTAIAAAIAAKGVTVPDGAGFEDFPALIAGISGGAGALTEMTGTVRFEDSTETVVQLPGKPRFAFVSTSSYDNVEYSAAWGEGATGSKTIACNVSTITINVTLAEDSITFTASDTTTSSTVNAHYHVFCEPAEDTEGGETEFPAQPESTADYTLIDSYTDSQTWTAPEDGWYLVEVHGASGDGGLPAVYEYEDDDSVYYNMATGGSGAGSGYAASVVKLAAGDVVALTVGDVGETTGAVFNATSGESYNSISVAPGGNGGNASASASYTTGGAAGAAGAVSGGNIDNVSGSNGIVGTMSTQVSGEKNLVCVAGGAAGHADGNEGGRGAGVYRSIAVTDAWTANEYTPYKRTFGAAGFVKISRGNTNIVA